MIRVAVVDDHPIARRGIEQILAGSACTVVVSAGSARELTGLLDAAGDLPDVIVLDLYHDGDEPCLAAVRDLGAVAKVLVVSASGRADDVIGAIRAGACGYVTKHADESLFVAAVETVAAGGFALSSQLADILQAALAPAPPAAARASGKVLSAREEETLGLIARGFTHAQAATRMGVSKATVDTYVELIRVKLQVGNKAELTRAALERLGPRAPDEPGAGPGGSRSDRAGDRPVGAVLPGRRSGAGRLRAGPRPAPLPVTGRRPGARGRDRGGVRRPGRRGSGSLPPLASGCVDWPASKFLQTPLTSAANGGTGSVIANPHYGTDYHVGCNGGNMNQQYAVDLGMRLGDPVLAPGGAGTVLYAAQAPAGWETCGLYVVVDHGGGWWSVVCHLSAIYVHKGQQITNNTVIGAVGGTGGFEPHLHFSLMKNAALTTAGGVYGGQSARARHVYHLGCTTGYYDWISQGMQVCY